MEVLKDEEVRLNRGFSPKYRLEGKCRLCLATQSPEIDAKNYCLKDVEKLLRELYGFKVGIDELWHPSSKICISCKLQLESCYKFFCQVTSTISYLQKPVVEPPKKRPRLNSIPKKSKSDDIEIVELIEDHEDEENIIISDDDLASDNTDLDFDFTDDEKDKEAPIEIDSQEDETEHTKVVNQLLDSGAGIEGEIDCCLIDKKMLSTTEGKVSEEVTVVLKDSVSASYSSNESSRDLPPISKASSRQGKRNSIHESEYFVCERCKTIYHRPIGSDTNWCLKCQPVEV